MSREILFKAKCINGGKWIYGDLIHHIYGTCISDGLHELFIDESTLCQYTGLTDKNCKKIWENDICKRVLLPTKRITNIFRISYIPVKCCFSAIDLDGSNVTFISDYINSNYEVEIIGNIIDNPELLEGGAE